MTRISASPPLGRGTQLRDRARRLEQRRQRHSPLRRSRHAARRRDARARGRTGLGAARHAAPAAGIRAAARSHRGGRGRPQGLLRATRCCCTTRSRSRRARSIFSTAPATAPMATGVWPGLEAHRARLFVAGPEPHFPAGSMFYNARLSLLCRAPRGLSRATSCSNATTTSSISTSTGSADFIDFRRAHPRVFPGQRQCRQQRRLRAFPAGRPARCR